MTRQIYEQSLLRIEDDVMALGMMSVSALSRSVDLLAKRDFAGSRELIAQDREIDARRYAVEASALTLIATQAPVGHDMRLLAAIMFIANEMERVADYGKGIARVNIRIGEGPLMKPAVDISRMCECAWQMLNKALLAFMRQDATLARSVIPLDDEVDALYEQVYAEQMTCIMEDPGNMRQANLLLMAAHNLERAADRATNVCERVIYSVTGELVDTGWEEDFG